MALSLRKYNKSGCITFKSTKGKYGGLSNMAPGYPLFVNGLKIRTSEALYQALRFPDFPELQEKIINFSSPIFAKRFSRSHIKKTRADWGSHRFKIMKFCLEVKLFQNKEKFSKVLLETNCLPIVEYTVEDKVWGATLEENFYIGTNALGRLLMELRENIKNGSFMLTIPKIENFKLFGNIITLESINSIPNNAPEQLLS